MRVFNKFCVFQVDIGAFVYIVLFCMWSNANTQWQTWTWLVICLYLDLVNEWLVLKLGYLSHLQVVIWMEGTGGGSASPAAPVNQYLQEYSKLFQYYLDKSTPHTAYRWIGTSVIASIYVLRVFYVQGFYIVSYGLGIYLLNLLIGFLSPLVDPELEPSDGGPLLPTKGSDEFKPFIRRLPEFKFW